MSPQNAKSPEALLIHAEWLQRLACRLVSDPGVAEDLVQETWVRSLERPPRSQAAARGWLARVLTNLAYERQRGDVRRSEREERAARASERPQVQGSDELYERFTMQRELMAAVDSLDAISRQIVLLRYFDGLPRRRIAQRLALTPKSVDGRLQRALAKLRVRLDQRYGDRRAWALAFLPWARPASTTAPLGPLLFMSVKTALILAASVVLAASAWLFLPDRSRVEPKATTRADLVEASPSSPLAPQPASEPRSTERSSAERSQLAQSASETSATNTAISGWAFLADGTPAHETRIGFVSRSSSARSDGYSSADGAFEFEWNGEPGRVHSLDEGLPDVLEGLIWRHGSAFEAQNDTPAVVVVAPNAPLAGTVVDERGNFLEGARMTLAYPEGLRARIPLPLDAAQIVERGTSSGEDGRYRLSPRPAVEGSVLRVFLAGYEPHELPLPLEARDDLAVVLQRIEESERLLFVHVHDNQGNPLSEARVALGRELQRTNSDGECRFDLEQNPNPDRIFAVCPGWLPVEVPAPRTASGESNWPSFVQVRFERRPLSITGRNPRRGRPTCRRRARLGRRPDAVRERGHDPTLRRNGAGGESRAVELTSRATPTDTSNCAACSTETMPCDSWTPKRRS